MALLASNEEWLHAPEIEEQLQKGEIFMVEKIIDKRQHFSGVWFYKVRWLGYKQRDDTWEPIENLSNCVQIVEAFDKQWSLLKSKMSSDSSEVSKKSTAEDLEFWEKANEGCLPIDDQTIYEKVKQRRRSSSSTIEKKSAADDKKTTDENSNIVEKIKRKCGRPFANAEIEAETLEKWRKIENVVENVLVDLFSTPSSTITENNIVEEENSPRTPRTTKKRVTFADQNEEKQEKKSKRLRKNDETNSRIKKIFECTVNRQKKKTNEEALLINCGPNNSDDNSSTSSVVGEVVTHAGSPDLIVNIDVVFNGVECGTNLEEENVNENDAKSTTNSAEATTTTDVRRRCSRNVAPSIVSRFYFKNCVDLSKSVVENAGSSSTSEKIRRLQKLYELLDGKLRRVENFLFPVTYVPSEEEKRKLWNSLCKAINLNDVDHVKKLLADYRSWELGLDDYVDGNTLLMICASIKCADDHAQCAIMNEFLECGADPNVSIPLNGKTALMVAAQKGSICKTKILLRNNAHVDAVNVIGESALFLAIRKCPSDLSSDVVGTLLRFGANYRLENVSRKKPLDVAESSNKSNLVDTIKLFLDDLNETFDRYLKNLFDSSFQILPDTILPIYSLQIVDDQCWTFSFRVQELLLPPNCLACLFLASANFSGENVTYFDGDEFPVKQVVLNDKILFPVSPNLSNILRMESLRCGKNDLAIQMKEMHKNSVTRLIIRANVVTNVVAFSNESESDEETEENEFQL